MKILIADDNAQARMMLELMLGKLGYDVISEVNGVGALKVLCGDDSPDLAILDWEMPQMNGDKVCQMLRAQRSQSPTYIILLTANTDSKYVVHGFDAGADDYLVKPFNVNELGARLRCGQRTVELRKQLQKAQQELKKLRTNEDTVSRIKQSPPPLPPSIEAVML